MLPVPAATAPSSLGRRPIRGGDGFTALEVILAVAIVGILLGIGFVRLQPPASRLYANDLKAQLLQAKYEAVKRNLPVAVVWNSGSSAFETRFDASLVDPCNGSSVLATNKATDYPGVAVSTTMSPGVVWFPNGQGVTCTNGTGIASVTTISDGRTTRTVSVHLGGGVQIQ